MKLRALAIALPFWALIGPAVCSAACAEEASRAAPADSGASTCAELHRAHGSGTGPAGNTAAELAGTGGETSLDCCGATRDYLALQDEIPPAPPAALRVTASLGLALARIASPSAARPCGARSSPFVSTNPPLLI